MSSNNEREIITFGFLSINDYLARNWCLITDDCFLVPPTIVDSRTSSDIIVKEGSPVNMSCEATGSPKPQLRWRRADGEVIKYQGGNGNLNENNIHDMFSRENAFSLISGGEMSMWKFAFDFRWQIVVVVVFLLLFQISASIYLRIAKSFFTFCSYEIIEPGIQTPVLFWSL